MFADDAAVLEIVVEGHHDTAGRDVEAAVRDLTTLLADHRPAAELDAWTAPPDGG